MLHSRAHVIASARRLLSERQFDQIEPVVAPLLKGAKPDPEALFIMGLACEGKREFGRARDFATRSLGAYEHHDGHLLLARCHRAKGETDDALSRIERALALKPDSPHALLTKVATLEEAGRVADARACLAPLMAGSPGVEARYEHAKLLVQEKENRRAIEVIDGLLPGVQREDLRRAALYLKAKACDRAGEYEAAMEAAAGANAIGRLEFDPSLYVEQVGVLIENWSREAIKKFPLSACQSDIPVFVAGMPRSGTSLIDQIIDAHPRAAGVGELSTLEKFAWQLSQEWDPDRPPPACFGKFDAYQWTRTAELYVDEVKRQAPLAKRIVNKALGNNKLVGLLARLFPRTRIIHAIRDPRDVAVSCFMGGFNNALHPWTTQLDWIARAWEQSMRMMDHWKRSLDVPILDVHYEKLVHDPEREFPRIIEFLGLEWDDSCRKFHESRRTVRTLSYDQVNRPLYTSSAGRNANYAPFLAGVRFPAYEP